MNLIDTAYDYLMEGLNPLPLKSNKSPKLPEGHNYLYEKVDETDIEQLFKNAEKIGIACGMVSDGFYCIDFDCHQGQSEELTKVFDEFMAYAPIKGLVRSGQLSAYTTMKQGYHVYFKSSEKITGTVLAKYSDGHTMIEIRGHGQYAACYPSEGYNHHAGVEILKLQQLEDSPALILDFISTFSKQTVTPNKSRKQGDVHRKWGENWKSTTPDGKYNIECGEEALELIQKANWQYVQDRYDNVQYWCRPNKDPKDGFSATWGFHKNMWYVFSTEGESIAPFESHVGYSPFQVLTLLRYNGDWKRAKDDLRKRFNMEDVETFWSTSENGRYQLNNYRFKKFLESHDYFKFSANDKSTFEFVQKDGIFLNISYEKDLKDFVLNWILQNDCGEGVYNMMSGGLKYFKREYLSMIETKEIKTMKDDANNCYLYYRNCIVKINKEGRELLSYDDLDINVWRNQVIDRDFTRADHHKSEYRTFIWLISGKDEKRYKAFQTVIGYLMHSYKTNSNNKAIIFNDEIISETPNGRSGKGLFWNALRRLKNVNSLDGKTFDFNKSFPYQSVSTDCQILVFDDVKKNFTFENLFSVITEGITIEYKGKDSIKLDVTESPKIIITTNYTVRGEGASFVDRMYEVEMSSYFNENHTPIKEFGHELFNDWDEAEWSRFDNYMMECVSIYLREGLVPMPTVNLKERKLINDLGVEMIQFCETIEKDEWHKVFDLFLKFQQMYPEKKNTITQNKITIGVKAWCKNQGYTYQGKRNKGIAKLIIHTGEIPKTDIEIEFE